jgi:hypothetical protein
VGLTAWLAARAAQRPRVLQVAVPGFARTRMNVEAALDVQGWPPATAPAGADLLVVAGPASGELAEVVDRLWAQMPGPRSRLVVRADRGRDMIVAELRATAERLATGAQAEQARERGDVWGAGPAGDGDMGGMGGMEMPAGLGMADRADDRDGLKLDVLHVPLGPVLPYWPAGLVVDAVLQGDVVQEAASRLVGTDPVQGFYAEAHAGHAGVARELDGLARLLALVGWSAAAARMRALRDVLLTDTADDATAEEVGRQLRRLGARLTRSRSLRWATAGRGLVPDGDTDRRGLPRRFSGDAMARWQARLDMAQAALAGETLDSPVVDPAVLLAAAVDAMVGHELSAARVILASFDPDTDALALSSRAGDLLRTLDAAGGGEQ